MKFILLLALLGNFAFAADNKSCDDKGKIYRVCTDQAKIFDSAWEKAKAENKHLLVVFGADWCPWCVSIHRLLSLGEEGLPGANVVVEEIGLYQEREKLASGLSVLDRVAALSKSPVKRDGVPLLAVINPKNSKATFINTAPLEKNTKVSKGHDPKKLSAAVQKAIKSVE